VSVANPIRVFHGNVDFDYQVRWTDDDGVAYELAAARLIVKSRDRVTSLLDIAATPGTAPDHWATFHVDSTVMTAIDYNDICVYEITVERSDGASASTGVINAAWDAGLS
jgi:hypothetical protein